MNTKIIKTITITNTEEWFLAASPQGGKRQWKDGYSSKELARFVTENKQDFHNLIQDVINEEGINCNFLAYRSFCRLETTICCSIGQIAG